MSPRRSIATRMLINTCIITGIALVVSGITVTFVDLLRAKSESGEALTVQTRALAENVAAAIEFGAIEEAQDMLQIFEGDQRIGEALVFDSFGDLFASYRRQGFDSEAVSAAGSADGSRFLTRLEPVTNEDETVGSVRVTYDLAPLYRSHGMRILIQLGVLLAALLMAVLLSFPLQRRISEPLRSLASIAGHVTEENDYGIRGDYQGNDELGTLTMAFNRMLEQIQSRDRQLQRSKEELEQRVVQRTADLNTALKTAELANRSKSEFLANMSHEIRTPMTAILGYAELTLEADLPAEERERNIQTVLRNGKHLLALINDILDVSKIDAGKMTVERIQCSPGEILADVAALMRERASSKGIVLEIRNEGPIPRTIQTDPTRLRQILVNLVGNAIKFTETGSVRVVAKLLEENDHDAMLGFSVIDSGIGMTPDQQRNLFKSFSQADSSTTRRFGGTGLGLVISKRLAELLGGAISVRSALGEGSTFSFSIATGSLSGVERLQNWDFSEVETDEPAPVRTPIEIGGRILLAEDGPDNQRLISYILRRAAAEVTVAENGEIAVNLALEAERSGNAFDAVLMDMHMPVMDGYTATGTLREAGYSGPIIALTAHAMKGERDKCIAAGCDDYLTKPVDRVRLLSTLEAWMSKAVSRES